MRYLMTPWEPMIARDSRPFSNRIRSLERLPQTVIAGAIRTALWKNGCEDLDTLKKVALRGPLPMIDGVLSFPRPLDVVVSRKGNQTQTHKIRPIELEEGEGFMPPEYESGEDERASCSRISLCAPDTDEDFKPEPLDPYWSAETMQRWLADLPVDLGAEKDAKRTFDALPEDVRVHVSIDPRTGANDESKLFTSTSLDYTHKGRTGLSTRSELLEIDFASLTPLLEPFTVPVGGERRLAEFSVDKVNVSDPFAAPEKSVLGPNIRLVLATPGIFARGWLPDWIDPATLKGTLPGIDTPVTLVSAITGRWQPISGWSYEKDKFGPKPMRRMVPAGSVYFLRLDDGSAVDLAPLWLKSICTDSEQNMNDGFGLALWGTW